MSQYSPARRRRNQCKECGGTDIWRPPDIEFTAAAVCERERERERGREREREIEREGERERERERVVLICD